MKKREVPLDRVPGGMADRSGLGKNMQALLTEIADSTSQRQRPESEPEAATSVTGGCPVT